MNPSFLKLLLPFLIACNSQEKPIDGKVKIDSGYAKTSDERRVIAADSNNISDATIDTTINGNIVLWNPQSVITVLGDLSGKMQELPTEGAFVIFKNRDGNKYLKMVHLPGSDPNTFRFFEVGYTEGVDKGIQLLSSSIEDFKTESGVRLGIALSDFEKGSIKKYTKKVKGDGTEFVFSETIDGLRYSAFYFFKGLKLVKFGFGYDNP